MWGWGFGSKWHKGRESRPVAVGFAGKTARTERCQVSPPGCAPTCRNINANSTTTAVSSQQALKASSCAGSSSLCWIEQQDLSKTDALPTGGTDGRVACALTAVNQARCWGDNAHKITAKFRVTRSHRDDI